MKALWPALACLALFAVGCSWPSGSTTGSASGADGAAAPSAGASGDKLTIAMIPKGTTHVFWKSVEAGAKKAAEELGVELIWQGPLKEDDKDQQIKVV